MKSISIVIPVINEEKCIEKLIPYLFENAGKHLLEIIVVDGHSTDATCAVATRAGAVVVSAPKSGRATQMNFGAAIAKGNIFYFIHADSFPPKSYGDDISEACRRSYSLGRYRTKFISSKSILKINAFFTRFDWFICYGGDQTFFITRDLFTKINGFDENLMIMEDYEIVERARIFGKYIVMPKNALVSARKYEANSWLEILLANRKIIRMYKDGASQEEMISTYKMLLIPR